MVDPRTLTELKELSSIPREFIPVIIDMLLHNSDPLVRFHVVGLFWKKGLREINLPLLKALQDPWTNYGAQEILELSIKKKPLLVHQLLKLRRHSQKYVRQSILHILKRGRFLNAILLFLKDEEREIRLLAANFAMFIVPRKRLLKTFLKIVDALPPEDLPEFLKTVCSLLKFIPTEKILLLPPEVREGIKQLEIEKEDLPPWLILL
ncbi:MAG: hypothetical protein QXH03_00410 [Candidatus Bathyarchaeia archaeon]